VACAPTKSLELQTSIDFYYYSRPPRVLNSFLRSRKLNYYILIDLEIDSEIDSRIGSGIGTRPSYPELGGIPRDAA
jgi:hypothetical protein